jgi:hypothetical protein
MIFAPIMDGPSTIREDPEKIGDSGTVHAARPGDALPRGSTQDRLGGVARGISRPWTGPEARHQIGDHGPVFLVGNPPCKRSDADLDAVAQAVTSR